jgi:hypothetical protein
MAKDRPDYLIGDKGVNLVASPLHTPDGGLLAAQNVEFIRDFGIGGIGSRGGLAKLNTNALAGAVRALANIPLALPGDTTLMVPCDTGETETWKTSVDGAAYTDLLAAVIARMASMDKYPATVTRAMLPPTQRIVSFGGNLYFPGDNYVITDTVSPYVGNTAAVLDMFNGAASFEQFRVPAGPSAVGPCRWITDLWVNNGVIYVAVFDFGGVAPDHKGRVLAYNPNSGALTQIGKHPWGNGTAELRSGFPFCLTSYLGQLWAGGYGVTAAGTLGNIYRILPGVDVDWTLDKTAVASSGYFTSLCEYNGNLYAASTANDVAFAARVEKRTAAGVWSTSFTGPDTNTSYCCSLIVFNSLLFAAYFKDTVRVLVKVFDGTTWTTDKDVGVDFANLSAVPGAPFIFESALYWPFTALTSAAQTGFILKRTTGGTWTKVLDTVSLRGALGTYVDD